MPSRHKLVCLRAASCVIIGRAGSNRVTAGEVASPHRRARVATSKHNATQCAPAPGHQGRAEIAQHIDSARLLSLRIKRGYAPASADGEGGVLQ